MKPLFSHPSAKGTVLGSLCLVLTALPTTGCESDKVKEPTPTQTAANATASASATPVTTAAKPVEPPKREAPKVAAKPVASVPVSPDDPLKGKFTMEDATKGLPGEEEPAGEGQLMATLDTEAGKLECELWPDKAPLTVANFVGLARGLRPWKQDGKWVKKPLYDGTVFHRIIKGFMIQGGDPKGNGSGEPGYVVPDEIWEGGSHNEPGLLCMANRGPNTNGAQFFILHAPSTYLDNNYTIFGKCGPFEVIDKLASHKVMGDKAVDPPKIKKVTIERKPAR